MKKQKLTKQEESWIYQYLHARYSSVVTAYEKPSDTKKSIEENILYRMKHDFKGFDYRIMSHSAFTFSCGFQTKDENGNHFLIVCTRSSWYNVVPIETINPDTGEVKIWTEFA